MLLLTSVNDVLQLVTDAAADVEVHASWLDVTSAPQIVTPGRTNTPSITTATTTTVVGSPAAGAQRNVKTLHVRNEHASTAVGVTVQHTDGTTVATLFKVTLAAGETLAYVEGVGFAVYDSAGAVRTPPGLVRQQIFTDVGLDAGGQATVTLGSAPSNVKSVFATCRQDRRLAAVLSLAGAQAVIQVRRAQYERATLGDLSAQNAPTGVTIRSTSGGTTAAPAAGVSAQTVDVAGGSGNAENLASYDAHVHVFNALYQHGHAVTQTFTDAPVAASETVDLLVTYL